jgi:MFS family permease
MSSPGADAIAPVPAGRRKEWWFHALTFLYIKATMGTCRRTMFPYASFLADGAGVSTTAMLNALAVMNIFGSGIVPLLTPYLLSCCGHRWLIIAVVLCMAAAQVVLGSMSAFEAFVPAVIVVGCCKGIMDPAVNATYQLIAPHSAQSRASLNAVVEVSWGVVSFCGMPAFGALLALSPQAPFFALAAAVALGALPLLHVRFAPAVPQQGASGNPLRGGGTRSSEDKSCTRWKLFFRRRDRACLLTLLFGGLAIHVVSELAMITFGLWLTDVHGWEVGKVASATFAIGAADLVAEAIVIVAFIRRRVSPFLFARIWTSVLLLATVLLPLLCANGAVVGIVCGFGPLFLAFECSVVSLMSSVAFASVGDGTLETAFFVCNQLGKFIGDVLAVPLNDAMAGGVSGMTVTGGGALFIAVIVACIWLKEPPERSHPAVAAPVSAARALALQSESRARSLDLETK